MNLEATVGLASFYAGGGAGVVTGTHVQRNNQIEAGAGFSYPVYRNDTMEVRSGLNLIYFGFNKNLGGFTLGQGGYFSPQQFIAALIPIDFRHRVSDDLVYEVGGGIGVQSFRQRGNKVFPDDPLLQAALVAQQANPLTAIPGVITSSGGTHEVGIAGAAHASIDYRLTPNVHIGARVGMEHAGTYTEGSGLLYARYIFNDVRQTQ